MAENVDHVQYDPDYIMNTYNLLLEQFKSSGNIVKLLQIISEKKKEIDDEVIFLGKHRTIDTATGISLDNIGEELGVPRSGASDEDYRVILKIRSYRTRSSGTTPQILDILSRFTGTSQDTINIYLGSQKSFDIAFYGGCLDTKTATDELIKIFPILSSYRLLVKSGSPIGFTSVFNDSPPTAFLGFSSVFNTSGVGGHLASLLIATP